MNWKFIYLLLIGAGGKRSFQKDQNFETSQYSVILGWCWGLYSVHQKWLICMIFVEFQSVRKIFNQYLWKKKLIGINNFIPNDFLQTEKVIYFATEAIVPLESYLNENDENRNLMAISWGIHQVAVSFSALWKLESYSIHVFYCVEKWIVIFPFFFLLFRKVYHSSSMTVTWSTTMCVCPQCLSIRRGSGS